MHGILRTFLIAPKPIVDPAIDLPVDTFNTLLTHYDRACKCVLTQIQSLPYYEPASKVNELLRDSLHAEIEFLLKGEKRVLD